MSKKCQGKAVYSDSAFPNLVFEAKLHEGHHAFTNNARSYTYQDNTANKGRDKIDVQTITGAIIFVFAPYRIASAKAIAPEGPAELNKSSFSQCASVRYTAMNNNNKIGKPINLIPEIKAIGMFGTKRL